VLRALVVLPLVALLVYALLRMADAALAKNRPQPELPGSVTGVFEEPAAIADGPDQGYGTLRLTPSQLVFIGNSGRITTVERLEITGATVTRDLPDRQTAKPVLAVTTAGYIHYFAVNDPLAWELRLLRR
jgi:hypothetical protein